MLANRAFFGPATKAWYTRLNYLPTQPYTNNRERLTLRRFHFFTHLSELYCGIEGLIDDASGLADVKAVTFQYEPDEAVKPLLETFRMMVNHAIWLGRQHRIRGRFKLINTVYEEFKEYGLHSHYTLSACEVACAILKNSKRSHRAPVAKRRFLKLDNQSYKLQVGTIRIPVKPREFITLKLKTGEYQRTFLKDATLKRGSLTLTEQKVIIAYEKT